MIILVRHGWSAATGNVNIFGQMNPTEVPLEEFGREQSVQSGLVAADELLNRSIRKPLLLYYSTHKRIRQSTVAFLDGLNAKKNNFTIQRLQGSSKIVERDHGGFDGLLSDQQERSCPEIYRKLNYGSPEERYTTKMPVHSETGKEGESLRDVADRIQSFMQESVKPHEQTHDTIIMTHGGILAAIQNTFWDGGVSSWIGMGEFQVPPTGSVVFLCKDNSEKSRTVIGPNREQLGRDEGYGTEFVRGLDQINDYDYVAPITGANIHSDAGALSYLPHSQRDR